MRRDVRAKVATVPLDPERIAEMLADLQQNLDSSLSDSLCMDEVLCKSLGTAIRVTGMDCGGIYLVDDATGSLKLIFHTGLPPGFSAIASHYDAESPNTQLVMAGAPVVAQFQDSDIPRDNYKRREELLAVAVLPILHGGRVVGCLNVGSHKSREVPQMVQEALEVIAAHMGPAIAKLKASEALGQGEKS